MRQDARLRIVQVDMPPAQAFNDLKIIRPDVVITEAVDPALLDAMIGEFPGRLVITVDAATDTLTIMSDREPLSRPVTELARIIAKPAAETGGSRKQKRRKRARRRPVRPKNPGCCGTTPPE